MCDKLLCIIVIAFILDPGFILLDLLIDIVISNFTIFCTMYFFSYRQGRVYKEYGYITRPTRARGHYYFLLPENCFNFGLLFLLNM